MKLNSLQFGKAMSAALFVLLLSVAGMKNALAQTQVATLQHGDTISAYYGMNAFVSAHAAAVDGDIITLSSGTFNCVNSINKSITIHGAGCMYDSITQKTPTVLTCNGACSLNHNDISFEGICFSLTIQCEYDTPHNMSFTKCLINGVITQRNRVYNNWQFINCIINGLGNGYTMLHLDGMLVINSVVRFVGFSNNNIAMPTTVNNSVLLFDHGQTINNIIAYNSIIITESEHEVSNCTFIDCIGIKTGETSLFEGQTTQNVMTVNSYEDVFETFTGNIIYDNIYQLNEDIATSFLGNDGTEVGIYGGLMPYNPRPSYMVMKRCNVAPRSTVDGKLSVDIEIIAEDE